MISRSTNFEFMRSLNPRMHRELVLAEQLVHEYPAQTQVILRRVLEAFVSWKLGEAWHSLGAVSKLEQGINRLGYANFPRVDDLHRIRMAGNVAVHDDTLADADRRRVREAMDCLERMQRVLIVGFEAQGDAKSFLEPPRIPIGGDVDRLLELEEKLAKTLSDQEQRLAEAGELASIWPSDGPARERFQTLTRRQAKALIDESDSTDLEGAFAEFIRRRDRGVTEAPPAREALEAQQALEEARERHEEEQAELRQQLAVQQEVLARYEKSLVDRAEWSDKHPGDDWTRIPSFMEGRLLEGLPPFARWLTLPSKIGEGTHGVVYRCYPESGGVPIAVKIPRPGGDPRDMERAWKWEIDAARALATAFASDRQGMDGIPRPLDISPDGYPAYVCYEIVEGRTIRDLVRSQGNMDPRRALFIIDRLSATLQSLLKHRIRFTDLHDRNVMIRNGGQPVLVDIAPCVPAGEHPPEWIRDPRFEGTDQALRSGQHFLLGRLFLRLVGAGDSFSRPPGMEASSFDGMLMMNPRQAEDERRRVQRIAIEDRCRGIPGFDGARVASVIEDLTFNPEARRRLKARELRLQLRSMYDPSGIMDTIFADS